MMHLMKPGVQKANTFRRPPRASFIPRWEEQEMSDEPSNNNAFQPLDMQQSSNHFSREYQVAVVDELHKRSRSTAASIPSFASYDVSRNNSSPNDESDRNQTGKRSRGNSYRAPREIKQTVTSVLGSLVGGTFEETNGMCRMRRQLSGSQLDQFMTSTLPVSNDDSAVTRDRAMSF